MPIEALGAVAPLGTSAALARRAGVQDGVASDFGQSLLNLVENVEQSGAEANVAVSNMLDKSGDVHDAMIALQRAEMTLQLTVQIRNKLVQAYQEIMRMPV